MKSGTFSLVVLGLACVATSQIAMAAPQDQSPGVAAILPPSTPGGLTSDEVARRAQVTSPNALAQRQAIMAAEARLQEAVVGYYPRLTVTGRYTRVSEQPAITFNQTTFGFPTNQYLLQAGVTVPLSDYILRLSHQHAAASHSVRAAKLDEGAAQLQAAVNGRTAYYSWLRALAQVTVSRHALENARGHLKDANNSFEAGTASKADVLAVESQVANAELVLAQAENLARVNEEQIRVAMHDAGRESYVVGEDLGADVTSPLMSASLGALWSEALSRRLEIRSFDENASSAREQAKAAKAGYYPNLSAFGDIVTAKPNPRVFIPSDNFKTTWDFGAQITWTPNDAFVGSGQHAEATARAAQIEAQKAALIDSVKLEVMQAYQAMLEAQVAIQTSTRGLAAAEESYRVRRELFRNGRATSVELTDAEIGLRNASFISITARANLRAALAQLQHGVGRDISDGDLR
jgi:outer membrane protein